MSDSNESFSNDDGSGLDLPGAVGPIESSFGGSDIVERARQRNRRRTGLQVLGTLGVVLGLVGGALFAVGPDGNNGNNEVNAASVSTIAGGGASDGSIKCARSVPRADGCTVFGVEIAGDPLTLEQASDFATENNGVLIAMRSAQLQCIQLNDPILFGDPGGFVPENFVYFEADAVFERRAANGPPVTVGGGNPWESYQKMWDYAQQDEARFTALAVYAPDDSQLAENEQVSRAEVLDWRRGEVTVGDTETDGEIFVPARMAEFGDRLNPKACDGNVASELGTGDLDATTGSTTKSPGSGPLSSVRCAVEEPRPGEPLRGGSIGDGGFERVDVDGDGENDLIMDSGGGRSERLIWIDRSSGGSAEAMALPTEFAGASLSVLGAADFDGVQGDEVIFIDVGGNSAKTGIILEVGGCTLSVVETEEGQPFQYLHNASGNACLGICAVQVVCEAGPSETVDHDYLLTVREFTPNAKAIDASKSGGAVAEQDLNLRSEAFFIRNGIANKGIEEVFESSSDLTGESIEVPSPSDRGLLCGS